MKRIYQGMKKALSLWLALSLLAIALPLSALAEDGWDDWDDWDLWENVEASRAEAAEEEEE